MGANDELKLAELISSRICHDLISPVGALNNGIEILQEGSGDYMAEAAKLIAQSASQASTRLAFFRIAFGAGGSPGRQMALSELRDLAAGLMADGGCDLNWPDSQNQGETHVTWSFGKFLLNFFLVSVDSLPRGGSIGLSIGSGQESPAVSIICTGTAARLDVELTKILQGEVPVDELTPRNVPIYLCACLAEQLNLTVTATKKDDETVKFQAG